MKDTNIKSILFAFLVITILLLLILKFNKYYQREDNNIVPTENATLAPSSENSPTFVPIEVTAIETNEVVINIPNVTIFSTATPTIQVSIAPTPTSTILPTESPIQESVYSPSGLLLKTGITYKGVMTAFSDIKGQQGDILKTGDCAVGRRNYLLSGSTRYNTKDSGKAIYKYSYIPYGSKLRLTLYNEDGTIKRIFNVTVKDDCLKRNQEKIEEIRYYNELKHSEIEWDEIILWVDLWVPEEEKDSTSIRQIGIEILEFGSWNSEDIVFNN